jgi:hypothetical protein
LLFIAVAFLFFMPVLPIAAVVVLIAMGVRSSRGGDGYGWYSPRGWRKAGVTALCAVVLIYWMGVQQDDMAFHEFDETCMLEDYQGDYGGHEHSYIPLRSNVVCGDEQYEMVPAWINPLLALLLVAAVGCFAVAVWCRGRIEPDEAPATGA